MGCRHKLSIAPVAFSLDDGTVTSELSNEQKDPSVYTSIVVEAAELARGTGLCKVRTAGAADWSVN